MMRNNAPPKCILFFSFFLSPFSFADGITDNNNSLENHCGYSIGKKLISKVVQRQSKISKDSYSEEMHIEIPLNNALISGTLRFSCLTTDYSPATNLDFEKKTASEEIELEDAGGRYARVISWESDFLGHGWQGTIAHTNTILGDGISMPTSDFFYICPSKISSSCFSLEVNSSHKITENYRDEIISFLSDVSYSF